MTRYLLCLACRRAWTATDAAPCCEVRPLDVNPFQPADARTWLRARLGGQRAAAVTERANLSPRSELRSSLWRAIEERGRSVAFAA